MYIKTFCGYSTDGLDLAVKDAYKDYEKWLDREVRRYTTVIEGSPATTATILPREASIDYWFTITITYRDA